MHLRCTPLTWQDVRDLPFTLTCYSEDPSALYKAFDCPKLEGTNQKYSSKAFKYAWNESSAGGSPNRPEFEKNPMFRLEISGQSLPFLARAFRNEPRRNPPFPCTQCQSMLVRGSAFGSDSAS
eukprot:339791-Rhodomonas_salina.2